jgi:DNA polymerase-3 subunit gamma/tau
MTGTEPTPAAAVPYMSLYRRFRPQRFSEVLGQEFVSLALRNAVREGHVGHAYLFSGPRGTGKTSSARILAKALNCAAPEDGEPCGVCPSCTEIAAGSSFDVHELDAASNNGVDAMRDLVAHAALGTPGRWKVYIVDEVHMLSQAASNALLKTLEEPPGHVVFVLATTDPQKVLPTIRSRTQHFEFRLIGPDTLHALLEKVRTEAGLELPEHAVEMAVSRGRGSARDALSVLDQVVSAGIVEPDTAYLQNLAEALATRDSTTALVALASAVAAGRDPLLVAGELAEHLRQGFLSVVAPDLVTLDGDERTNMADLAAKMGLPALVRAVEALGTVQVDMRESPDPRLHVEVCLLRLTRAEVDDSLPDLLERVERLERAQLEPASRPTPGEQAASTTPATPARPATRTDPETQDAELPKQPAKVAAQNARTPGSPAAGVSPAPDAPAPDAPAPDAPATGPALARRSLGAIRREKAAARDASGDPGNASRPETTKQPERAPTQPEPALPGAPSTAPAAAGAPSQAPAKSGSFPTRDELVQVWGDGLLASLPQRARARFRVGRFLEVADGVAVFALPNEAHRSYCEEVTGPVEVALSERFGVGVKLRLITDPDEQGGTDRTATSAPGRQASALYDAPKPGPGPGPGSGPGLEPEMDDEADLLDPVVLAAETEPAGDALSAAERLKLTFPGAEEV